VLARGRRRRRWQRLGLSGAAAVVVLAGVAGAGALAVDRRDAAIDRTEITSTPSVDGATNVLVVGSDRDDDGAGVTGTRADTMAVVRLDVDGSIRVLSIPRDLWNPPAHDRLNASLNDGPDQLVDDLTALTGIPIDHYVQLSFDGFVDLVDAVGGIDLRVDRSLRDASSGLDLAASPCTTVDGATTLALLRSRHLEVLRPNGFWVTDGSGDLGRIARGRTVMTAALDGLGDVDPTDLSTIDDLSRTLADHAVVDEGLDLEGITDLGRVLVASAGATVQGETLPVYDDIAEGGATVLRPARGAADVVARFGAPAVDPPSAGVPGAVEAAGFTGLGPC
jgi:LCP family protein required for cell wall assembly